MVFTMGGCQMPVQGDVKEHRGQNANTSATTSYIPFSMKENIIIMHTSYLPFPFYERKYSASAVVYISTHVVSDQELNSIIEGVSHPTQSNY